MKYSLQRFIAYLIVSALMLSIFPVYAVAVDSDDLHDGINYSFENTLQRAATSAPTVKNLIPEGLDPSFDSGIKFGTANGINGVYYLSNLASTAYEYDAEKQCFKITAPTNAWGNLTLRGFSFEEGKTYVVSYDTKLENTPANEVKFSVDLQGTKTLQEIYKPIKRISNTEWTRIYALFGCETANTTTHLAFRFQTDSDTILIDNIAIYEINYDTNNLLNSLYSFEFAVPSNKFESSGTPELYNDGSDGNYSLKIPTGVVTDGKLSKLCKFTGLSVNGGYNYELSADVKLASAAEGVKAYMTASADQATGESITTTSIKADGWTTITRTVPVLNDGTLDVGIGLEGLSESGCDVLVDNVVVKKSSPISDDTDDPTDPDDSDPEQPTPVDPNNLLSNINYGFENEIEYTTSGIGLVKRDDACTITRTMGTDSLPAQEGNSYAMITGRSGTSGGIRVQGAPAPTVGQMYIASVYVRLGQVTSEKVTAKISLPGNGQNTVQATIIESPDVELSTGEWTKVYRIFKVEPKEGATEPYTNRGFHIDFSTNTAGTGVILHVDNFDIREYTPDALAVTATTPEDNSTNIDKDTSVKVTFNNRVTKLESSQVSISGGAVVEEVSSDGEGTHTIKIKGMRNSNTYTVTLSNLKDIFGGTLASYSFSFTTGARVPLPNLIVNPGLEDGTNGWGFTTGHWERSSEEYKSGAYSLRCQGTGEGPSCQAYQELTVEKNTEYVFSFYAKIATQTNICLRQGSQEGKPTYDGTLITLTPSDQWKRYVIEFNSGDNTAVRLWLRHSTGSNGPNYYDDFMLAKHINPMEIEYSSVKDGDTNVPINIGKIVLDMSYKIDDAELAGIANKFSIDNGAEFSSVDVSADGCTVELHLNANLKNNTTYTLTYDKITDECGITSEKGTISFTTKPAFMVINEPELSGSTAAAVVENCSSETVNEIPVLVAAVYNADKTLSYIKTSPFAGSINAFDRCTLSVNDIALAPGQTYKLYLITSSEDMTLLTSSVGDGAGFQTQTGKNTSVNPQENVLEVAGKAQTSQEVLILVLKTEDNVSAYDSYIFNKVSPAVSLTELNIGTYVYNLASAVADENGDYNVVIPMQLESTEKIYGVLCEADSINGEAEAIYMPSTDVYNTAKSVLTTVNGATLGAYMDTYAKAFGMALNSPTYSARKDKILKALYSLYPQGGYADFTSFGASKSFKKDFDSVLAYYERQDEAVEKINSATNLSLKGILSEYSDVLGDYEDSTKLDFASKYAQYGEVNINRQLVGITYTSMANFIEKFKATTYTPNNQSSLVSPGGSTGGGKGSSAFGGGLGYVPENIQSATKNKFSDIADVSWAADSINKLADCGIISGFENGEFRPHNNVTREQFLKMLMLSLDLSAESGENNGKFSDVNESDWYAPYVMAAYNLGIVNGLSDNTFGIGQHISRQDMAVMIYRATKLAGVELAKVRDISFDDENSISPYALEAVNVLSDAGIINGMSETTFEHYSNTTRAQSAVVLDRIIALKGEN